jgi:hypothetical protein
MSLTCNKPGCTLAETGTCILENEPSACPERLALMSRDIVLISHDGDIESQAEPTAHLNPTFALDTEQLDNLMRKEYCRVIGILGAHNAGKTACLVSLYLLLAHNSLDGFQFRNSKTIRAFEEISRGARWIGIDSNERTFTNRTEIPDERTPGFLHLRLHKNSDKKILNLVLPDLPGEWTNSLIETNKTERLNFLGSADQIWIVVNGKEFHQSTTRLFAAHRLETIIQRLPGLVAPKTPISIVVTHYDEIAFDENHYKTARETGKKLSFDIKIIPVASFSDNPDISAGVGIAELLHGLDSISESHEEFWPNGNSETLGRNILSYGKTINT